MECGRAGGRSKRTSSTGSVEATRRLYKITIYNTSERGHLLRQTDMGDSDATAATNVRNRGQTDTDTRVSDILLSAHTTHSLPHTNTCITTTMTTDRRLHIHYGNGINETCYMIYTRVPNCNMREKWDGCGYYCIACEGLTFLSLSRKPQSLYSPSVPRLNSCRRE